jgi:hypothetical protein
LHCYSLATTSVSAQRLSERTVRTDSQLISVQHSAQVSSFHLVSQKAINLRYREESVFFPTSISRHSNSSSLVNRSFAFHLAISCKLLSFTQFLKQQASCQWPCSSVCGEKMTQSCYPSYLFTFLSKNECWSQWRIEEEGGVRPPLPKFRNFDKAEPNSHTSQKFGKVQPDCKSSGTPD